MPDQVAHNHFGKFQLGDHQGRPYIILKKAPLKYYDDTLIPEDKTKSDVLFICIGGDWQFVDFFEPAAEDIGLTDDMSKEIEEKF